MKAIVLETRDGTAAVLRDDGVVLKVRGTYQVGETIELPDPKPAWYARPQMRMAFTAAVIVLAILIGGLYNYTTVEAASYVTVEGDVGMEFVLNRRNQIISINASDESGEELKEKLEQAHVIGSTLSRAVELTNEFHYETLQNKEPDGADHALTYTVSSRDPSLEEKLNRELEEVRQEPEGMNGMEARPGESMVPQEGETPEMPPQEGETRTEGTEPDGGPMPEGHPEEAGNELRPEGNAMPDGMPQNGEPPQKPE